MYQKRINQIANNSARDVENPRIESKLNEEGIHRIPKNSSLIKGNAPNDSVKSFDPKISDSEYYNRVPHLDFECEVRYALNVVDIRVMISIRPEATHSKPFRT